MSGRPRGKHCVFKSFYFSTAAVQNWSIFFDVVQSQWVRRENTYYSNWSLLCQVQNPTVILHSAVRTCDSCTLSLLCKSRMFCCGFFSCNYFDCKLVLVFRCWTSEHSSQCLSQFICEKLLIVCYIIVLCALWSFKLLQQWASFTLHADQKDFLIMHCTK